MSDPLSNFDFSSFGGSGLFVKFLPGEPLTLRVLTTDPMVTNESYDDKRTGETIVGTKFSFIVYNFTEDKAQIWKATAKTASKIGELHVDEDFGANIQKIDLKVTAPNKGEIKAYDIQVLPKARELTGVQLEEAKAIDLDEKIKDGQRMSFYKPEEKQVPVKQIETAEDEVHEVTDEPIDLSDIPF